MRVAIVGGGINGLCAAWQLALAGHTVELFERGTILSETSSSSSKLLHGGLRYLENYEFRLVKEALQERAWWLKNVPQYTSRLQLCLPVYQASLRSVWKIRFGLLLYDWLAGSAGIGKHKYITPVAMREQFPNLSMSGLIGAFIFYDGQMDEHKLGQWVANQAIYCGVVIKENSEVSSMQKDGVLFFNDSKRQFDCIINITGPWAAQLNKDSGISSNYDLDLVRGSHIIIKRPVNSGYLFEIAKENRVFFVLPYQGNTLIGTTEVRQTLDEAIVCSKQERFYLLAAYNHYLAPKIYDDDIISSFSGIRPLIKSADNPNIATREYAVERHGKMISVFGGKWTTARALARNIVQEVNKSVY